MPLTIRLAGPADAEAIAATLRGGFAEFEPLYTPAAFSATTPTAATIAQRFAEGPSWVAEQDGEIVGTVSAVSRSTDLYVRSMAVSPEARGRAVGARLMDAVETFAVANGHRRIVLNSTPFLLAALRLYEGRGYARTGERPDLFGTPLVTLAKDVPRFDF